MRNCLTLICLALAACTTVEAGLDSVTERVEAAFAGPARLYDDMAESDVRLAANAMQSALETRRANETLAWVNDETGNAGAITPRRTFITDRGVFCRVYEESLSVGGKKGVIENTACRIDEGEWSWVG